MAQDNTTQSNAVDTEQMVLSAMIQSINGLAWGLDALRPEMFYHIHHQFIFQALAALFDQGDAVDLTTLGNQLTRMGRTPEITSSYLATVATAAIGAAHLPDHVKIVIDHHQRRSLQLIGRTLQSQAVDLSTTVDAITAAADHGLSSIISSRSGGLLRLDAILPGILESIEQAAKAPEGCKGVTTGISSLDSRIGSLQPSTLVLVAARPSVGKSALAGQIALHVAERHPQAGSVLFFSVEMSTEELVLRMLTQRTRIEFNRLRDGQLADQDWQTLTKGLSKFYSLPIHIDSSGDLSILEARTRTKLQARKGPISLVVVDYLQLMLADAENRQQEISQISRGLKALAKEHKCPVLALCQMNRAIETRMSKMPQLSDLRESGSLEQDADVVMFLNDSGPDSNELEAVIAKNRNGPKGTFKLHYERQYFSMGDPAPEWRVEPKQNGHHPRHWQEMEI